MKKWDYAILICVFLAVFLWGFLFGYSAGKDVTTFNFEGLPEDTVIHFEVDKGGAE
jgi:hypothetical protein